MHGIDSFTCDWGGCDEPMVGYRLDDDGDGQSKPGGFGWLPVCQSHFDEEENPSKRFLDGRNYQSLLDAGVFDLEREILNKSH